MSSDNEETHLQFNEMALDDRLLEAIAQQGWKEPTLIQESAIPLALQGKDILAKARTGSGKTGAFIIPIIQKLLEGKAKDLKQLTKALILVPTKELSKQTAKVVEDLTSQFKRDVRCIDVSMDAEIQAHRPLLADNPDIVIGTPSKIINLMNANILCLKASLQYLVIDEADLMVTFEYIEDLTKILLNIPPICQTFMTSATLGDEVKDLKKIILRKPAILKLKEPPLPAQQQLMHYIMKVEEFDKAVLLLSLLSLNMMRGKTIIFVNSVDKGYKLALFLKPFGIPSCVLNSELPVRSRCDIVNKFNTSLCKILITSDDTELNPEEKKLKRRRKHHDPESGVSRGIDFHSVANVVNFDLPRTATSYIHHVGRTARGTAEGTALSFVSVSEMKILRQIEAKLRQLQPDAEQVFRDFKFDVSALDGFRYRATDVWKRCTSVLVKDFRRMEIKQQIITEAKLAAFFQENPQDLDAIKHDVKGKSITEQVHLRHVPTYNIPSNLQKITKRVNKSTTDIPAKRRRKRQTDDPLKSMRFLGFKKT